MCTDVEKKRSALRLLGGTLTLTALSLFAGPARAQDSDPDALFTDAIALMAKDRCAEALPKLEEAQRRDPGVGTQFNIGVCLEKLGRLASAWRNFDAVLQLALASGKKTRANAAREKLDALRPRLDYATFSSQNTVEVVIKLDGIIVRHDDWAFYPLDPGEHRVEALAAAKRSWSTIVRASPEGHKVDVIVPPLETAVVTRTTTLEKTNGKRALGFMLGGVGVVGLVGAAVTGALVLHAHATADERCTPACDETGWNAVRLGKTLVPINYIAWGVGVAGLGAGTVLLLTSRSGSKSAAFVRPRLLGAEVGLSF